MNHEDVFQVVMKLVGQVSPIGSQEEDDKRFVNLTMLCSVTDRLVCVIDSVARENKESKLHSRKRASDIASEFISDGLGISNGESVPLKKCDGNHAQYRTCLDPQCWQGEDNPVIRAFGKESESLRERLGDLMENRSGQVQCANDMAAHAVELRNERDTAFAEIDALKKENARLRELVEFKE